MNLEKTCLRAFDAVTRARGEEDFRSGAVRLELISENAARFRIDTASVCLDWSETEDQGVIRANCTCANFHRASEPCQHIWAAFLDADESKQYELRTIREKTASAAERQQRLAIQPHPPEAWSRILQHSIDLEASRSWPLVSSDPQAIAKLTRADRSDFKVELRFAYDGIQIALDRTERVILDGTKRLRLKRDTKAEKAFKDSLRGSQEPWSLKKLKKPLAEDEALALINRLLKHRWKIELDGKSVLPLTSTTGVLGRYRHGFGFAAAFDFSGTTESLQNLAAACVHETRNNPLAES